MEHLEEASLLLETIIKKLYQNEYQEKSDVISKNNFVTNECFSFKYNKDASESEDFEKGKTVGVDITKEKTFPCDSQENASEMNDKENVKEHFSLSEKLEIADITSGFEDLSTNKYDNDNSLNQKTEGKSNDTSEPLLTLAENNITKLSDDFLIDKNDEKPLIFTSTPKIKEIENSFRFNSLDNLNYDAAESSTSDFSEKDKSGDYLNLTIEEAIDKYEKLDETNEIKFKEVSVQTIIDQLLFVECRCGLLKSKFNDYEKIDLPSSQSPPSKKSKTEKNLENESESSKTTEDSIQDLKFRTFELNCSEKKISDVHQPLLNDLLSKDNKATVTTEDKEGSLYVNKIIPRIRVGLSKRAKPPPLHNKLIY